MTHNQEQKEKHKTAIAEQEARLKELEECIRFLRAWFKSHGEKLSGFQWNCYGWDRKIGFDPSVYGGFTAKDVAAAFGKEGWKREHSDYACGQVNWKKEFDGVLLEIEGAENIKPRLIEEVKIP